MVLLKRKVLDALKILLCLSGQAMAILLWKATRLLSQLSLVEASSCCRACGKSYECCEGKPCLTWPWFLNIFSLLLIVSRLYLKWFTTTGRLGFFSLLWEKSSECLLMFSNSYVCVATRNTSLSTLTAEWGSQISVNNMSYFFFFSFVSALLWGLENCMKWLFIYSFRVWSCLYICYFSGTFKTRKESYGLDSAN